jgi:hypothetical protein
MGNPTCRGGGGVRVSLFTAAGLYPVLPVKSVSFGCVGTYADWAG